MEDIVYTPIGNVRTPFADIEGMPVQPAGAASTEGRVVVDPAYGEGLNDLDGFSHLILIYHFHRSSGYALSVKPFLDDRHRGLFATRAPRRPNPIGLSVVRLVRREDNVLFVQGADMVDGTPLIDIKPFVPAFDAPQVTATGWLEDKAADCHVVRSDRRFKDDDTTP